MKAQLWYRNNGDNKSVKLQDDMEILTEPPDIQSKSGYHLVSKTDLPKPSEPGVIEPLRALPKTLLEIRNQTYLPGTPPGPLGRAVCQLLASGYVNYGLFQSLWQNLEELARAYDKLHRELQSIPDDTLRQADEVVASQK